MSLPEGDMELFDNVEEVDLVCVRTSGTITVSDVPVIETSVDTQRNSFSDVQLNGDETVFLVAATKLIAADVRPEQGDRITRAGGEVWEVVKSTQVSMGSRFKSLCRKVRTNE